MITSYEKGVGVQHTIAFTSSCFIGVTPIEWYTGAMETDEVIKLLQSIDLRLKRLEEAQAHANREIAALRQEKRARSRKYAGKKSSPDYAKKSAPYKPWSGKRRHAPRP